MHTNPCGTRWLRVPVLFLSNQLFFFSGVILYSFSSANLLWIKVDDFLSSWNLSWSCLTLKKVSVFSESTLQVLWWANYFNIAGETSKEDPARIDCSLDGQQIITYFSTKPRNRLLICLGQLIFGFSLFHHKKKTKDKDTGIHRRNMVRKLKRKSLNL